MTDPIGVVIPGATVTVVNQETNVSVTAVTDASGGFNVPYLAPGTYTVNVEKLNGGFAKASRPGLSVLTAQTVQGGSGNDHCQPDAKPEGRPVAKFRHFWNLWAGNQ